MIEDGSNSVRPGQVSGLISLASPLFRGKGIYAVGYVLGGIYETQSLESQSRTIAVTIAWKSRDQFKIMEIQRMSTQEVSSAKAIYLPTLNHDPHAMEKSPSIDLLEFEYLITDRRKLPTELQCRSRHDDLMNAEGPV